MGPNQIQVHGSKSDPANHRPISPTCLRRKVMEHIVISQIDKHPSEYNIMLDSQHGFRVKLSTVTQLISSCHDFNKEFREVPHRRYSVELSYYGINGSTLTWMNDFLRNGVQDILVNGLHSTWGNVTSAVPKGSVLGAALFLPYINDIKEKIQSNMRLYVDDPFM